LVESGGFEPP